VLVGEVLSREAIRYLSS